MTHAPPGLRTESGPSVGGGAVTGGLEIDFARHFVAAAGNLFAKATLLLIRIVQFGKGVAQLHARYVNLESLNKRRVIGTAFCQRGNIRREIIKDGWLNQLRLGEGFKEQPCNFTVRHGTDIKQGRLRRLRRS